jgi:hypothetical protein
MYSNRKVGGAAISLYQHWQVSLVATSMQRVWHQPSSYYTYSRSSPTIFGNWEEQHIQPIRNKEKMKNRF